MPPRELSWLRGRLSVALRRGRWTGARPASCTLATQIGQRSAGVPWRQNFDTVVEFIGAPIGLVLRD
jgi:hypothetical protein